MAILSDWRTTFISLENRDYRWYWLSSVAYFAAAFMQLVVRGWLVYDLTDSPLALGLVSAGAGIAIFLVSPYGGVIADRFDKRNVLLGTHSLMAISTLIIAVLIFTGAIALWHLVASSIVSGILVGLSLPIRQAILPQLVERQQLMNAVGLYSGATNMNRIIAPSLGGILVSVIDVEGAYLLMVCFYAVSAILMRRIPPLGAISRDYNATVRGDLVDGFHYIRRSSILLSLLVMALVPVTVGLPYQMLMPIFASDVLDVGPSGLGYLMGAVGVGALVGSLFIAYLSDYRHKGMLLLVACVLFGVFLVLFANTSSYYLSLLSLMCVGAASNIYLAVNNTLLMINAEDHIRGRVMSFYYMTIGFYPMAVLPAGAIIESLGAPFVVSAGGVIIISFTVLMALVRPTLRRV